MTLDPRIKQVLAVGADAVADTPDADTAAAQASTPRRALTAALRAEAITNRHIAHVEEQLKACHTVEQELRGQLQSKLDALTAALVRIAELETVVRPAKAFRSLNAVLALVAAVLIAFSKLSTLENKWVLELANLTGCTLAIVAAIYQIAIEHVLSLVKGKEEVKQQPA